MAIQLNTWHKIRLTVQKQPDSTDLAEPTYRASIIGRDVIPIIPSGGSNAEPVGYNQSPARNPIREIAYSLVNDNGTFRMYAWDIMANDWHFKNSFDGLIDNDRGLRSAFSFDLNPGVNYLGLTQEGFRDGYDYEHAWLPYEGGCEIWNLKTGKFLRDVANLPFGAETDHFIIADDGMYANVLVPQSGLGKQVTFFPFDTEAVRQGGLRTTPQFSFPYIFNRTMPQGAGFYRAGRLYKAYHSANGTAQQQGFVSLPTGRFAMSTSASFAAGEADRGATARSLFVYPFYHHQLEFLGRPSTYADITHGACTIRDGNECFYRTQRGVRINVSGGIADDPNRDRPNQFRFGVGSLGDPHRTKLGARVADSRADFREYASDSRAFVKYNDNRGAYQAKTGDSFTGTFIGNCAYTTRDERLLAEPDDGGGGTTPDPGTPDPDPNTPDPNTPEPVDPSPGIIPIIRDKAISGVIHDLYLRISEESHFGAVTGIIDGDVRSIVREAETRLIGVVRNPTPGWIRAPLITFAQGDSNYVFTRATRIADDYYSVELRRTA